jgi:hypothetical protein
VAAKLDVSQRLGNALKAVADRYGLMPGRLVTWLCQGLPVRAVTTIARPVMYLAWTGATSPARFRQPEGVPLASFLDDL